MKYEKESFTWGFELELGDIPRKVEIPEHLGSWEFSETDILNLNGEYKFRAADPLGKDPPFGGEINTRPTKTIEEQVDKIFEIVDFFRKLNYSPTISSLTHSHIHVFVPGLSQDIEALKRLMLYIKNNQEDDIEHCHAFKEHYAMKECRSAKRYLKFDGGRKMPDWMCDNIINLSDSFESFIKLHCAGKDGVSMGRPFRYAINTYCMKHIGTIEFRVFRGSLDRGELFDCFKFVESFMYSALNNGPSVKSILKDKFNFPKMKFVLDEFLAWESTKYDKTRGKKERTFHDISTDK